MHGPRPLRAAALVTAAAGLAGLAAGCSSAGTPGAGPSTSATTASTTAAPPSPSTTPSPTTPSTPADVATATLARLTLAQRVGQLIMVGADAGGASSSSRAAITRYHVGNAMLTGRSSAGVDATAEVAASLRHRATTSATGGVPLFVATDQEGGAVQVLRGPGFSALPSALQQGGWSSSSIQEHWTTWGQQLRAAGVDVDLAPVADVVPEADAAHNPPIGHYGREYGHTASAVAPDVVAAVRGLAAAHVVATPKHFPGLGKVTANTDVSSGVVDHDTTADDPDLAPFRAAIDAGAPFVMVSSAVYARIDPDHPACFSRDVVTGLLRDRLGFDGVVISDDVGQARQVSRWSAGSRAVQVVDAGGDVVLTVRPEQVPAMAAALLDQARTDPAFRAKVDAAALRVLRAKEAAGLLG